MGRGISFLPFRSIVLIVGLSIGLSIGLGSPPAAPAALHILERVHYTSVEGYTRVVITLSGKTDHKLFTLPADLSSRRPPRIVIDFSLADLGPRAPRSLPIHDGLLKQVRTGQFTPTTARVVLDVERIDEHHAFALYAPYRLVIDIRGKDPKGAKPVPDSARSAQPASRLKIMLDPGHGGKDPGALGRGKAREKNVALALSKRVARKLEAHLPVDVLFTRQRDTFIPLEERTALANVAKADLFISLHINASRNPQARGIETYYLNNSNDRATNRLAALENGLQHLASAASQQTGLSYILSDLIQTSKEEESISLANHLQNALVRQAKRLNPHVRNIGVKKGPFYVLVGAHMPCVLVEAGFITHTAERRLLLSRAYQDDLAEGLYQGIASFLREQEQAKSL